MTDEQKQINQLTYALGIAIGGLEALSTAPSDCRSDGIEIILQRLKEIAKAGHFYIEMPEGGEN